MGKDIKKSFSVIILAAGHSSRMGFPKALLEFTEQNCTFIEKIIAEYQQFECKSIVVVTNNIVIKEFDKRKIFFAKNVKIIENKNIDFGRLNSIKLGLQNIENSDFCFVQNVDNPFVNQTILKDLETSIIENGFSELRYADKGIHPILISQPIIEKLKNISDLNQTLKECLSTFKKVSVVCDDVKLSFNINTEEDYRKCLNR